MSISSTHIFCGIGGDTLGLAAAGFEPVLAANHSPNAVPSNAAQWLGERLAAVL